MSLTVGIPRSLFYYQYFPLWKTFFEELGAEVILSENTSKKILEDGVNCCVDDACLPIKIYHGHVMNIKDKADYLFVPRFTSISKDEYICPKFGGLPDMIKSSIKDLGKIIDTEIDLRKSKKNSFKAALEIGLHFTDSKFAIRYAYKKALKDYRVFRETVKMGMLPNEIVERKIRVVRRQKEENFKVLLMGHMYNIYDRYINMDIVQKLRKSGVEIITLDMLDNKKISIGAKFLSKKMFWNFGKKALGGVANVIEREGDYDGIMYLMSFGCGIDSFVCDLVERKVRRESNLPFSVLTLDEHSGEAGMNTRIEAYIDMLRWRRDHEGNISAHG